MAADIYDKSGELELAIDQLRKAIKISPKSPMLEKKLSALLSRRGKELLDSGDTETGYGYLQQAKAMNPDNAVPAVTLRSVQIEQSSGIPSISAEVWNPTDAAINSLKVKVELFDNATNKSLWNKEESIVDEFVPPLGSKDSKHFSLDATVPVKANGQAEFRVYLDGALYKAYPIGKKEKEKGATASSAADSKVRDLDDRAIPSSALKPIPIQKEPAKPAEPIAPPAKPIISTPVATPTEPTVAPQVVPKGSSAEEKTMKDLEP